MRKSEHLISCICMSTQRLSVVAKSRTLLVSSSAENTHRSMRHINTLFDWNYSNEPINFHVSFDSLI